jgi:hypothetical protein
MKTLIAQVAIALLVTVGAATISGPGQAQTMGGTTAAPGKMAPAPKKTATAPKDKKPRTAASVECSRKADTKHLHGKPRKEFRKDCLKQAAMMTKK